MKNLSLLLAFGGLAALPACTINYYGTGPGGHGPRRSGSYNGRDSSQVTVITQSGTGGGVGTYPPPVRTGGGTRPPVAYTPPVRTGTGGGVRNPPPTQPGGVRGPGRTTSASPMIVGGIKSSAAPPKDPAYVPGGIKSPAAPPKDPVYVPGGIKSPPAPIIKPDPAPVFANGGIKPVRNEPSQESLYGTGGIKGPHPVRHDDEPMQGGSIRTEPEPTVKDPLYGTGGIKGPHPVTNDGDEAPIRIVRTGELPNPGPGKDDVKPDGPAFMFSKSPCLGPCPSYTATVWADGRVLYNGQGNVPRIGIFNFRMDPATVTMLLQQAKNVGFTELRDHYASGATDIPATTLTIYQANGRSKTVVVEDNAPDEVNALFGNVAGAISGVADGGGEEQREEK